MKNVNIELDEATYWKLKKLKAEYEAKSWGDFMKIVVRILGGLEGNHAN